MQLIKLNEIYRGDNKSLFEDPCDFIPRSFDKRPLLCLPDVLRTLTSCHFWGVLR